MVLIGVDNSWSLYVEPLNLHKLASNIFASFDDQIPSADSDWITLTDFEHEFRSLLTQTEGFFWGFQGGYKESEKSEKLEVTTYLSNQLT